MDPFDEIIKEFLVESYESLDQLDRDLIALEDAPDDRERLASIFRTVHTIKGTSGFLAFPKLEKVAHVGENLLVPLRDGELRLEQDIASGLLGMVDAIRDILSHIEECGAEGEQEYGDLIKRLEELLHGGKGESAPSANSESESSAGSEEAAAQTEAAGPSTAEEAATEQTETSEENTEDKQPEATVAAAAESTSGEIAAATPAASAKKPAAESGSSESSAGSGTSLADSTVRIDVQVLDRLMNLVGELVLSRNQVLQFSQSSEDAAMIAASQRLNLITTELQEGVMKTRMQPIRNAWSKLPRVVRDLSRSCGKQVQVVMEGADTELDKTILEAIKDPLTHIVRNSVDHGIEPSDERVAAGKPAEGTLWLRAFHESGQVNIEVADDGRGIGLERVKNKAIEKGLVTAEQAAAMNERELTGLILLPGFSTAQKVTNVSGRGVGMDVVKTNIERIGGTLDINTIEGQGTTLRIKIPLTLAIVPALMVTSGEDRYAIPQVSLLELVRLEREKAEKEIEFLYGHPVYRLRGNLLPLLYLDEELKTRVESQDSEDEELAVNIVVLQAEDRQFGLIVDGITDTQEIVVKPLGQYLKSIPTFAGATIMGDGSVALILDVIGIAQQGGILTEHSNRLRDDSLSSDRASNRKSWLLVDPGDETRAAVPLESVARLEEFTSEHIEIVDHQSVVQYRDQIMPLVNLSGQPVGALHLEGNEQLQVVVYNASGVSVGIVVGSILDIVEEDFESEEGETGPERMVITGRVTRIVDPDMVVRSAGINIPAPSAV